MKVEKAQKIKSKKASAEKKQKKEKGKILTGKSADVSKFRFQSEMQSNKSMSSRERDDENISERSNNLVMSSNSNVSDSSHEPLERKSHYARSFRHSVASRKSRTNEDTNSQVSRKSLYKQIKELTKKKSRVSKIQQESKVSPIASWTKIKNINDD